MKKRFRPKSACYSLTFIKFSFDGEIKLSIKSDCREFAHLVSLRMTKCYFAAFDIQDILEKFWKDKLNSSLSFRSLPIKVRVSLKSRF